MSLNSKYSNSQVCTNKVLCVCVCVCVHMRTLTWVFNTLSAPQLFHLLCVVSHPTHQVIKKRNLGMTTRCQLEVLNSKASWISKALRTTRLTTWGLYVCTCIPTYIHTSHKDDIYVVNNSVAWYQYSVQLSNSIMSIC